jgi:hypothetical protein
MLEVVGRREQGDDDVVDVVDVLEAVRRHRVAGVNEEGPVARLRRLAAAAVRNSVVGVDRKQNEREHVHRLAPHWFDLTAFATTS